MEQYRVMEGQSLFDVAIIVYGSASMAVALADQNGLSLTDTLKAGQLLKYDPELAEDEAVVEALATELTKPATDLSTVELDDTIKPQGIGHWAIEQDFKVS